MNDKTEKNGKKIKIFIKKKIKRINEWQSISGKDPMNKEEIGEPKKWQWMMKKKNE